MIFIPNNVPSSKNSKQWTGKFLINSKTVAKYKKATKQNYLGNKNKFLEMIKNKKPPYKISLKFVRDSHRRFDYHNACQIVFDLMVEYGWIEDDNADFVLPVFEFYEYNKEKAGVEIKVL